MRIAELKLAAIDFESTGGTGGGEPIQVGIATMWALKMDSDGFFVSDLAVTEHVSPAALRVHGITASRTSGAPSLVSLWREVDARLRGRWVIAHGAGTERRFLRAFPSNGFGPWIDSLTLARALYPELESYSLEDLAHRFDLGQELAVLLPERTWHDALFDAAASLLLFRECVIRNELQERDAEVLLHASERAYRRRLHAIRNHLQR